MKIRDKECVKCVRLTQGYLLFHVPTQANPASALTKWSWRPSKSLNRGMTHPGNIFSIRENAKLNPRWSIVTKIASNTKYYPFQKCLVTGGHSEQNMFKNIKITLKNAIKHSFVCYIPIWKILLNYINNSFWTTKIR